MRATTLTPRSWPSSPTLATSTRPGEGSAGASSRVVIEPPAGLAPEQPGIDHARQQWRWGVQRLLELLVEAVGAGERGVEADQVGEAERAHRVVAPLHHAGVDVVRGGEAAFHHADRRQEVRDEQGVDDEPGAVGAAD